MKPTPSWEKCRFEEANHKQLWPPTLQLPENLNLKLPSKLFLQRPFFVWNVNLHFQKIGQRVFCIKHNCGCVPTIEKYKDTSFQSTDTGVFLQSATSSSSISPFSSESLIQSTHSMSSTAYLPDLSLQSTDCASSTSSFPNAAFEPADLMGIRKKAHTDISPVTIRQVFEKAKENEYKKGIHHCIHALFNYNF